MNYSIEPFRSADIDELCKNARQADINEVWSAAGLTFRQGLEISLRDSVYARTGRINGDLVAMFGISKPDLIWLLSTTFVYKYRFTFLKVCRKDFHTLPPMPFLHNYVNISNDVAITWLTWLGFNIEGPIPFGLFKQPFYHFYKGEVV